MKNGAYNARPEGACMGGLGGAVAPILWSSYKSIGKLKKTLSQNYRNCILPNLEPAQKFDPYLGLVGVWARPPVPLLLWVNFWRSWSIYKKWMYSSRSGPWTKNLILPNLVPDQKFGLSLEELELDQIPRT